MKVRVKLLGIISFSYPAFREFRTIDVRQGDTIRDLRQRLGLPEACSSVNGKLVGEDYELKSDDEVLFFSPASGG
ncbi:MoaD/ThiS family protein [Calderihabitans maritimus]|uniref:Sulfur transfer protein ThiS n=1 Tax=Calderihabitans maritimus TaxID=1246530 RepID=A0A1Z5HNZ5_9FIRM|nr:MoaD/ThiS family protein [Calderihabitans maritimus]GAW91015.1 sulfur transfer protein ThiS [Calderihabitans maritimus]